MPKESVYFIAKAVRTKKDVKEIKRELDQMHGILSIAVNSENGLVSVDYDSSGVSYDKIENKLNKMGFEIAAEDTSNILTR